MTVQIDCPCGHRFSGTPPVDKPAIVCPNCGREIDPTSAPPSDTKTCETDATLILQSESGSCVGSDESPSSGGVGASDRSAQSQAAGDAPTLVVDASHSETVLLPADKGNDRPPEAGASSIPSSGSGGSSAEAAVDATQLEAPAQEGSDETGATVIASSDSDLHETVLADGGERADAAGKAGSGAETQETLIQSSSDDESSELTPTIIGGPESGASEALDTIAQRSAKAPEVKRLGHFEVQRVLGQGAFGTVYLAYDPRLDRKVAVKVAQTGVLVGKADVDRFLREARSAAQLRHPHIVPVYEVGQIQFTNFIAYEFVEGQTLKGALKQRGKFSINESAVLVSKLASALHYAHQHGIVHRDMKPDNVMLDVHGEPHIMDFGLARRDEADTTRTREGTLMGTPAYMSPEQASGESHLADARSDVWSLGVMFDEMLTGVLPFEGTVTEVLLAVKQREPTPLRQIDPTIPKDVETICHKCLTKSKEERYQTAEELSEELERYLRGEPIKARPIGVLARTWRWARRNPAVASLIASVFVILSIASVVSGAFGVYATRQQAIARDAERQRALEQVKSLRTTVAESVPFIIDSLQPYRGDVLPRLHDLEKDTDLSSNEQIRVRLGLFALDPGSPRHEALLGQLYDDLLRAPADEFRVIRGLLKPDAPKLGDRLWEVVNNQQAGPDDRFHAACALALYDSRSGNWGGIAGNVTGELLTRTTLELPDWIECLRPVRTTLLPYLETSFRSADRESDRQTAAIVVSELYVDDPKLMVDFVRVADDRQLGSLLPALSRHVNEAVSLLREQLGQAEPATVSREQAEDVARVASNLAMALLHLRYSDEHAWRLLSESPDKRIRSLLIERLGSVGIEPWILTRRLETETDRGIRIALYLSLGQYGTGAIDISERKRLAPGFLQVFREHPDPGVHSAVEWLLSRWGYEAELRSIEESLRSTLPPANRHWQVNGQGQTMAIIPGPIEFQMGSAPDEPHRVTMVDLETVDVEKQRRTRIPRSYGISTKEVTVAEFLRFDDQHEFDRQYSRELNCPIIQVNYYDAAKYCRWLSEREGIPEDQMCYPPVSKIRPDMTLPEDMLDRTGYRMPTAAEWEYACRAGAITSRCYGDSDALLPQYAWFFSNAENHTWPVGQLKPNDFGLFDMHGNVIEWCHSRYFDDPTDGGKLLVDGVLIDGTDNRAGFYIELRGGAYSIRPEQIRTADRDHDIALNQGFQLGIRLARTYKLGDAK